MPLWNRYPVFRVFLALTAGIISAYFLEAPFIPSLILLAVALAFSFFFGFYRKLFFGFQTRWIFGAAVTVCFFCSGIVVSHLYGNLHSPRHLIAAPNSVSHYYLQLEEDPLEKENSYGAKAKLIGLHDSDFEAYNTKLMLYLAKSPEAAELRYGDRLSVKTKLNEIEAAKNPYEFDYRNFLRLKGIHYQAYADSSGWQKISGGHGFWLLRFSKNTRRKMMGLIDQWRIPEDEKAISKALLLGFRNEIEDEQLNAYSAAGAMHVLAVSGLHVGIVYLMASWALVFLTKVKHGELARSIILIFLLWLYACITGLSPSVVRASTMFSFVAFGASFKRTTSIYNTILGSAMLLLFIKPTYLFEVGFQLSYAAVFGIVWLQPKLESLWDAPNWILSKGWGIVTVSIAAQVGTFPLALYYFHQFPMLFILSNLAVIPLVTGIMYGGLGCLLISALGWIPHLLITVFHWFLFAMNCSVHWIESQTFQLIQGIHITKLEVLLLYVFVLLFGMWLMFGGYRRLVLASGTMIVFGLSQISEKAYLQNNSEMLVYSLRDRNALGFFSGKQNLFFADADLRKDENALGFHVFNHWYSRDADDLRMLPIEWNISSDHFYKKGNLILFADKSYWLANSKDPPSAVAEVWLVLSETDIPDENLKRPEKLVLGNALGYWQHKEWLDWCKENSVEVWDVKTQGAYIEKTGRTQSLLASFWF